MREKWLRMEEAMEREVKGRKAGVLFSAALCALCLLLSLPFVSWIRLVNISALFSRMGITREMAAELYQSYGIFNLLSFVEKGKQGALGLYAMICLLLLLAVWYFQLSYLWRVLRNKKHKNGNLGLYVCGRAATVLAILLAAASQGFVFFANATYGMKGFLASPVIYLVAALSALSYGMIKRMEKRERLRYHEHGLLKELRKNWVLFLMLVPTFVYFLINSYLPMVGVYYAFTNFNFRDGLWASPFVGFKNFEFLFKGDLVRLIRNTVLYNVAFILLGNLTQIFFAILVSQVLGKWFKKITQTLMFMPYFVSYVLLKVLVYNMFEYDYGVINSLITAWGGHQDRLLQYPGVLAHADYSIQFVEGRWLWHGSLSGIHHGNRRRTLRGRQSGWGKCLSADTLYHHAALKAHLHHSAAVFAGGNHAGAVRTVLPDGGNQRHTL